MIPVFAEASTYARNVNKKSKLHAILICSVVVGRKEHLRRKDPNRIAPRKGYDSVCHVIALGTIMLTNLAIG